MTTTAIATENEARSEQDSPAPPPPTPVEAEEGVGGGGEVVIAVKGEEKEARADVAAVGEVEKVCSICHLSPDQSMEGEAEVIQIGCGCKNELGSAHRNCAQTWFQLKGNRYGDKGIHTKFHTSFSSEICIKTRDLADKYRSPSSSHATDIAKITLISHRDNSLSSHQGIEDGGASTMCCEICCVVAKNITLDEDRNFTEEWHVNINRIAASTVHRNTPERIVCWRGQPFCNFLMACLVIAFILPWFFQVNMF